MNEEEVSSLLNSSLEYIAKWYFVAHLLRNNQQFKNPQISDISRNSLSLRIIDLEIKNNNYKQRELVCIATDSALLHGKFWSLFLFWNFALKKMKKNVLSII